LNPHPIALEDFQRLYRAADDPMRAILLLALNACMYGGEVVALNWSDIDLTNSTLVSTRPKTGVVRVAVLWPETVAALGRIPRRSDSLFLSADGDPHTYQSLYKVYKSLRRKARVGSVQFSQIRDGAYTAAVEAGVSLDVCRLLAGHATGISDHYVKRRPTMVAEACRAIRDHYRISLLPTKPRAQASKPPRASRGQQ